MADKSAATQNKDATDGTPNAIAAPGADVATAQQTGFGVERVWGLAELAATALEANPATRESWQRARAAAAREQKALAAYGPNIGVEAGGDYFQEPGLAFGYGSNAPPDREFRFTPQVYASWLLLDFGRRDADTDRARGGRVRRVCNGGNLCVQRFIFLRGHCRLLLHRALNAAFYGLGLFLIGLICKFAKARNH